MKNTVTLYTTSMKSLHDILLIYDTETNRDRSNIRIREFSYDFPDIHPY